MIFRQNSCIFNDYFLTTQFMKIMFFFTIFWQKLCFPHDPLKKIVFFHDSLTLNVFFLMILWQIFCSCNHLKNFTFFHLNFLLHFWKNLFNLAWFGSRFYCISSATITSPPLIIKIPTNFNHICINPRDKIHRLNNWISCFHGKVTFLVYVIFSTHSFILIKKTFL